jgi:hypothetical protein
MNKINDEFKQKSLKLLADPCKFKGKTKVVKKVDRFKQMIEYKFNNDINNTTYNHVLQTIHDELVISSIIDNIIDQLSNDI